MRIVLTGGGSGGHFFPMIAVAQQIRAIAKEDRLIEPELIYMGTEEYDPEALLENNISFRHINAGKQRRYTSIKNFFDLFKTGLGLLKAIFKLFFIFPDVVFSKGGYVSVPVVMAARVFGIPVVIHESDAVPGRANTWAARFARRIAVSYPETAQLFERLTKKPSGKIKIALTGNPVRNEMRTVSPAGAHEFLKLSHDTPTILILGGSQGASAINETLIEALPLLVEHYQILHQTGKANFEVTKESANTILENNPYQERYHPFPFLNIVGLRMAAGAADLIISRAGSGAIFEIALWGKPSILIPIPQDVSHDQTRNAFSYARTGAGIVVDQANLTPNLLTAEINRLMESDETRQKMSTAAQQFAKPDAARTIAREILDLALEHEE